MFKELGLTDEQIQAFKKALGSKDNDAKDKFVQLIDAYQKKVKAEEK